MLIMQHGADYAVHSQTKRHFFQSLKQFIYLLFFRHINAFAYTNLEIFFASFFGILQLLFPYTWRRRRFTSPSDDEHALLRHNEWRINECPCLLANKEAGRDHCAILLQAIAFQPTALLPVEWNPHSFPCCLCSLFVKESMMGPAI